MKYQLFFINFLLFLLINCDDFPSGKPRKISGDAAIEKAQEPLESSEEFARIVDSSVGFDRLPQPPILTVGPPATTTRIIPRSPASSRPVEPPAVTVGPPSSKPPDDFTDEKTTELSPPPRTTVSTSEDQKTTVVLEMLDGSTVSVEVDDSFDPLPSLPDFGTRKKIDDSGEFFQKADVISEEKLDNDVKEIAKKSNHTDDYYVTSEGTTLPTIVLNDTVLEITPNFDDLFNNKKVVPKSDIISITTTTSTPTTAQSHVHTETCIHIDRLKTVDSFANSTRVKEGTIEVSVELDAGDSEEDTGSEEFDDEDEEFRRKTRQNPSINPSTNQLKWKKYEMDCSKEEDEKGAMCKLWAVSGLCSTHKPTMFLFCRKTCLCVGPN